MTDTLLAPERYLELTDSDTERLIAMGERGLTEKVPTCPGWDVAEVVWHTAGVYEHKVRVMADRAWPDPWPPADFDERDELPFLREAKDDLFSEFSQHDPSEQTATFGADETLGFWIRRMSLEAAVHRYDAELAHAATTPVADDLALDGVDEILHVMLGGPWWSDRIRTQHPVDAVVAVESAGLCWTCDVRQRSVTISSEAGKAAVARVTGAPQHVFLWLWGREGDDAVELAGDLEIVAEFRRRLVECLG